MRKKIYNSDDNGDDDDVVKKFRLIKDILIVYN